MQKIYSSASKIIFIVMTLALVVFTYLRITDPKDFMILASMVFAYYFTKSPAPVETNNDK